MVVVFSSRKVAVVAPMVCFYPNRVVKVAVVAPMVCFYPNRVVISDAIPLPPRNDLETEYIFPPKGHNGPTGLGGRNQI